MPSAKRSAFAHIGAVILFVAVALGGPGSRGTVCAAEAKPVIVVNPQSQPVPTANVNDGRNIFQPFLSRVIAPGQIQSALNFTLPAGKRFAIEFMSLYLSVPDGNSASCLVSTGVNPGAFTALAQHSLVLVSQGPDGQRQGQTVLHAAQPIKMYADHSTEAGIIDIQVQCTFAQDAGNTIFRASLGGYLVDIP